MAIITRSAASINNKKRARSEESVDEDVQPLSEISVAIPSSSKKAKTTHNKPLSSFVDAQASLPLQSANLEQHST